MDPILLTGKKELDIYINPLRQALLRELAIAGQPLTPKQLSLRLGISASSVQHHLARLLSLGVVELSHTQVVRGITAHYYRATGRTVRIGGPVGDALADQRLALMQNGLNAVFSQFSERYRNRADPADETGLNGDILWGVARLPREEAGLLLGQIREFLRAHDQPDSPGEPWEYALIACPVAPEAARAPVATEPSAKAGADHA